MSLSTKVLFFCFSSLLLLPCQKTLVFRFFSINSQVILKNSRPLASNFSILLSNLLKKISIQEFYDTETTTARRKQKNKTLVDRKQLFPYLPNRYIGRYRYGNCIGRSLTISGQIFQKFDIFIKQKGSGSNFFKGAGSSLTFKAQFGLGLSITTCT